MKLKTLEEMRWAHAQFGDCQDIKTDLKELAIQWIKILKKYNKWNPYSGDTSFYDLQLDDYLNSKDGLFDGLTDWIKFFFNLKETDINEDVK